MDSGMNRKKMTILFAGGGTGGHLFPGIALAEELSERDGDISILFATGRKRIEHSILEAYNFPVINIATRRWASGVMKYPLMIFFVLISWMRSCIFIIHKRISTVIGLGGYSSFGPLLAAYILRRDIYLLEQNSIPGRTNRLLSRFADAVFTQFASCETYFKRTPVRTYGNPVRKEIRDITPDPEGRFTICVAGGSQGAAVLNEIFIRSAEYIQFPENSRVIHLCGREHYEQCREQYSHIHPEAEIELIPFQKDMADVYRKTSLCICRAGATSIAEMTCIGLPMIMVPFPFATEDHQFYNAQEIVGRGGGICIRQEDLTGEKLAENVNTLVQEKNILKKMSRGSHKAGNPRAAELIADYICGNS